MSEETGAKIKNLDQKEEEELTPEEAEATSGGLQMLMDRRANFYATLSNVEADSVAVQNGIVSNQKELLARPLAAPGRANSRRL
jgi:hypothetical protein